MMEAMKDTCVKESVTVAVTVALSYDPSKVTREQVVAKAERGLSNAMRHIAGDYYIESSNAKLLPQ